MLKASDRGRRPRVNAVSAQVGHHDRSERSEAPDKGPRDAEKIGNQCISMGNLEAVLVDVRDVPELAELGKPGLKQPDRRGIMIQIQVADSPATREMATCASAAMRGSMRQSPT